MNTILNYRLTNVEKDEVTPKKRKHTIQEAFEIARQRPKEAVAESGDLILPSQVKQKNWFVSLLS